MPTAIENAQFLASLFQPTTDAIGGLNAAGVKIAQMGYQDRLRQVKRQQELDDAAKAFEYHKALTTLQTDSAEKISEETTKRYKETAKEATDRAIQVQDALDKRAEEKDVRARLSAAMKDYRLLAGKDAKKLTEFGKDEREQLDGLEQALAVMNDNTSKARAKIALQSQRAYNDELTRINTITDKDEPILVANAIGAVSNKEALDKVKKLKARDVASIATILGGVDPQAAAEFAGGYQIAKDGLINSRSKNSRLTALQKDLEVHYELLKKDPKASEYVALGMVDEVPPENPTEVKVRPLNDIFKVKQPGTASPDATDTLTPAPGGPEYGGLMGLRDAASTGMGNFSSGVSLARNVATAPFGRAFDRILGGQRKVEEGNRARTQDLVDLILQYKTRNYAPPAINGSLDLLNRNSTPLPNIYGTDPASIFRTQ